MLGSLPADHGSLWRGSPKSITVAVELPPTDLHQAEHELLRRRPRRKSDFMVKPFNCSAQIKLLHHQGMPNQLHSIAIDLTSEPAHRADEDVERLLTETVVRPESSRQGRQIQASPAPMTMTSTATP